MKIALLLLALVICTFAIAQQGKGKSIFVITKTSPYCGGANPPEEILNEAKKPRIPFDEKFYIIKGGCNTINRIIIDSLIMDSSGKAISLLKPGCYSIINEFGYKKINVDTSMYDMACFKKLLETPLFTFEVSKGKNKTFTHNIAELCPYNKPCYKGKIAYPM